MIDREAIDLALFERLTGATAGLVKTHTRSPTEFRNTKILPALGLFADDEPAERRRHVPPIWTLNRFIRVYVQYQPAEKAAPDSALNVIADAIEAALERQDGEESPNAWETTLGGLVQWAWVTGVRRWQGEDEGEIEVDVEIRTSVRGD